MSCRPLVRISYVNRSKEYSLGSLSYWYRKSNSTRRRGTVASLMRENHRRTQRDYETGSPGTMGIPVTSDDGRAQAVGLARDSGACRGGTCPCSCCWGCCSCSSRTGSPAFGRRWSCTAGACRRWRTESARTRCWWWCLSSSRGRRRRTRTGRRWRRSSSCREWCSRTSDSTFSRWWCTRTSRGRWCSGCWWWCSSGWRRWWCSRASWWWRRCCSSSRRCRRRSTPCGGRRRCVGSWRGRSWWWWWCAYASSRSVAIVCMQNVYGEHDWKVMVERFMFRGYWQAGHAPHRTLVTACC